MNRSGLAGPHSRGISHRARNPDCARRARLKPGVVKLKQAAAAPVTTGSKTSRSLGRLTSGRPESASAIARGCAFGQEAPITFFTAARGRAAGDRRCHCPRAGDRPSLEAGTRARDARAATPCEGAQSHRGTAKLSDRAKGFNKPRTTGFFAKTAGIAQPTRDRSRNEP